MTKIKFENGITVNFDGVPTDADIEEVAKSVSTQQNQVKQQKNDLLDNPITRGIQSFFPGKKVGEAIGTGVGAIIAKAKGTYNQYDLTAPTPLQVAGDVAQGAATIAGFKGVGSVGSVATKALQSAGLGATQFAGKSAAEGGQAKDIIKSGATGALVGAGTSLAISGIGSALEQVKKLPERLINSATGQSKKEILAGKGLSDFVLKEKKIGTAQGLLDDSQTQITKLNDLINKNLEQSVRKTGGSVTIGRDNLLDEVAKLPEAEGALLKRKDIQDVIQNLAPQAKKLLQKPSLTLTEANKLRQLVDRSLGSRAFIESQIPTNKLILRSFANTLRETVKSKAPEGTRSAFNSLSNEIRLSDSLASKIAQGSRNQIISFGDLIGGGLGGAVGGVPGAFAGAAARRVVQSTPVLTGTAVVVDKINKAIEPILKNASPAIKTTIISALSNLNSSEQSQFSPEVQRILNLK